MRTFRNNLLRYSTLEIKRENSTTLAYIKKAYKKAEIVLYATHQNKKKKKT